MTRHGWADILYRRNRATLGIVAADWVDAQVLNAQDHASQAIHQTRHDTNPDAQAITSGFIAAGLLLAQSTQAEGQGLTGEAQQLHVAAVGAALDAYARIPDPPTKGDHQAPPNLAP
jgi:hypothetical protein